MTVQVRLQNEASPAPSGENPESSPPSPCPPSRATSLPHWLRLPSGAATARAAGLEGQVSFRRPFRAQRCLVPATGFSEWQQEGGGTQPSVIRLTDQGCFGFAGRWDSWRDERGQEVRTDAIVTTTPDDLVAPIHDRLPVVLRGATTGALARRADQRRAPASLAAAPLPGRGHGGLPGLDAGQRHLEHRGGADHPGQRRLKQPVWCDTSLCHLAVSTRSSGRSVTTPQRAGQHGPAGRGAPGRAGAAWPPAASVGGQLPCGRDRLRSAGHRARPPSCPSPTTPQRRCPEEAGRRPRRGSAVAHRACW